MTQPRETLLDLLKPGLDLVICGTAAGRRSAKTGQYYANPRNCFWQILADVGLTPRKLSPREYHQLTNFGIGLTDLAKFYSGSDAGLREEHFDVDGFRRKIEVMQPRVLAFNGKKAAEVYFDTKEVGWGRQKGQIRATIPFVLPSTSGTNGHWNKDHWVACAAFVKNLRGGKKT